MKTLALAIASAFFALGSVHAASWNISGTMSGAQEVTPNLSNATGSVSGLLDDASGSFDWMVQFAGLTGGAASGGHFHTGAVGVAGDVIIHFTSQISGQFSGSASAITALSSGQVSALLNGNVYVNIHNNEFPGGEIRAQLLAAPVPEPESWAMLSLGLLVAGAAARRARRA